MCLCLLQLICLLGIGLLCQCLLGRKQRITSLEKYFILTSKLHAALHLNLGGVRALAAITVIQDLIRHSLDLYIVLDCEVQSINRSNCVVATYWVCQIQIAEALLPACTEIGLSLHDHIALAKGQAAATVH